MFLQRMLKLVVEEGKLRYHLGTLKDFFLLGRGELFVAFIDQARTLLSSQATSTTEYGKIICYLYFTLCSKGPVGCIL